MAQERKRIDFDIDLLEEIESGLESMLKGESLEARQVEIDRRLELFKQALFEDEQFLEDVANRYDIPVANVYMLSPKQKEDIYERIAPELEASMRWGSIDSTSKGRFPREHANAKNILNWLDENFDTVQTDADTEKSDIKLKNPLGETVLSDVTIETPMTNPPIETEDELKASGKNHLGYPITGGDVSYDVPMDWQGAPDSPIATHELGDLLNLSPEENLFQIPPHMSTNPRDMGLFEDVPEDPSRLSRLWSHIGDNKAATAGWGLSGLSLLLKGLQGDNPRQKFAKGQMAYKSPYETVPFTKDLPEFQHGGVAGQQTAPLDSLRIGLKDAIVNSIDDPNREGKNSFVPSMLKAYDEIGKFGGEDVPAFAQGGIAQGNNVPAYAQGGVAGQPYIGGPTDGLVGEAGLEWIGKEENAPIRGQALFDLINVDNPMAQFYNGGYAQNDIPAFYNGGSAGESTLPQDKDLIDKLRLAPPILTAGKTGGAGNITNEFVPPEYGTEDYDVFAKGGGGASTVIQGSQGVDLPPDLPRQVDPRRSLQFREHHETLKEMLGAGGQSLGETSGQMAYGRGMAPLVMQSQWQDYEQDMRNRGITFDQIMQQNRFNENQRQFATQADLQAQQIAGSAAANYNPYGVRDAIGDVGNILLNYNAYRSR